MEPAPILVFCAIWNFKYPCCGSVVQGNLGWNNMELEFNYAKNRPQSNSLMVESTKSYLRHGSFSKAAKFIAPGRPRKVASSHIPPATCTWHQKRAGRHTKLLRFLGNPRANAHWHTKYTKENRNRIRNLNLITNHLFMKNRMIQWAYPYAYLSLIARWRMMYAPPGQHRTDLEVLLPMRT